MMTRRFRRSLIQVGAAAALTAACVLPGQLAQASPSRLTDVTFALAVNPPDQGQIFAYVPKGAGFFKQNGLNVAFQPNTGGSSALKQLAAGNAQFAISSPENLLNGLAGGEDLRAIAVILPRNEYKVGVLKTSSITKISQLKGKKVGVSALTSGSFPIAQASLAENGIDPASDVTISVVGNGGPALNALQTGQVDAVVTTDTQFAIFKSLGGKVRFLPKPALTKLPADELLVQTSYFKAHPKICAAFARAVMEGTVFALANPAKAVKFFEKQYPEVANAVSAKANLDIMKARLANMRLIKQQKGRYGYIPLYLYEKVQQEDLKLKTIQSEQDLALVMTNSLHKQIDNFDIKAIQKKAKGK